MATKDIRDRLVTILGQVSTLSGTKYTVAPRVPLQVADFEEYVTWCYQRSGNLNISGTGLWVDVMQWSIDLISPPLLIGSNALREDYLYDYADSIKQLLMSYQRLEDVTTRAPLTGVFRVSFAGDSFTIPYQFNDSFRALWRLNLEILYSRAKDC